MAIFSIWIISRAGGLIYQHDYNLPKVEVEKTFSYPLDLVLKVYDEKVVVAFGQRDGIKVGHTVLSINGQPVEGRFCRDEADVKKDVLEFLNTESNYPMNIKFGRPKLSTNEKIMLAGMFHSLYAIASQLSPQLHSSGIQLLETDTFKLHAFQTLTGIKFVVVTDPKRTSEDLLLKRLYEIYADFALKNPFYSIDMPIR
ncbi:hypothetical protein HELRODRAFT_157204 [Helobdella robusta]|uniref:Trafficking protein particle complex subunit n=1 Tax=Helobdella robusta TaxID=6412 RepID=T1EM81_HELRO|nr:hypothetical protein HELRODRAFT_157204 [Helobdella robusta]ESO01640.1 hypothetical protein HELRODRAFT_157204 [Helobdella robusta]